MAELIDSVWHGKRRLRNTFVASERALCFVSHHCFLEFILEDYNTSFLSRKSVGRIECHRCRVKKPPSRKLNSRDYRQLYYLSATYVSGDSFDIEALVCVLLSVIKLALAVAVVVHLRDELASCYLKDHMN